MKNKKAISLIVLIITIIVMIILASAIIMSLDNANIFNKAEQAVENANELEVQDLATMKWMEAYTEGKKTKDELKTYVIDELEKAGIDTDEYAVRVTTRGVDVVKSVIDVVNTVPIPKGFVASQADGESTKAEGLVIYEGTEPVTDGNVEQSKRNRNQYVWVPVEDFSEFKRSNFGDESIVISNIIGTSNWEVELDLTTNLPNPTQSNITSITKETLEEVQEMYASVKKYKGFYIARYEAGADEIRKTTAESVGPNVYSQMGRYVYNCIPLWKTRDTKKGGAIEVARNIYSNTNRKYGVVSTLVYGVQWDTILKWLLDTGEVDSLTESAGYGNYTDTIVTSVTDFNDGAMIATSPVGPYKDKDDATYPKSSAWIMTTGALKIAKTKNIYDMAGNVQEWTMEERFIYRGGRYNANSSHIVSGTIVGRSSNSPDAYSPIIGFRTALYIK